MVFLQIHDVILDDWSFLFVWQPFSVAHWSFGCECRAMHAGRLAVWSDARPLAGIDVGTALQDCGSRQFGSGVPTGASARMRAQWSVTSQ